MAQGVRLQSQVLAQRVPGLPARRPSWMPRRPAARRRRTGLPDGLGGLLQPVQHRNDAGQLGRVRERGAAKFAQIGAVAFQPFAQAIRLARVGGIGGASDGIAYAGVAVQGVAQVGAGIASQPARRVRFEQVGGGDHGDETVLGPVEQVIQLLRAGAARGTRALHFADAAAGRLQRGPQGGPLRPGHGAPCRRASLGAQAGIHAGQRVGKIGQSPVAMGHGQRGVLPRAAAPHQRRHQNRPGCARDEEQRVAQALDDCGRGQLGRHHEAGRQQRADDGGRRSQHAQQAAQGAAQEGQRQQQPQMGRAHAGQQAIHTAGQSSASMAPARCRNGPPGSPKQAQNAAMALQPSRGSSSSTARITGAALVAAACRASSQRMRRTAARQERGGSQAAASFRKGPAGARRSPTMPGRPPMRLLWQVIANFAATCRYGYTSVTFAPRGRKIIWRNRRKSPKT